MNRPMTFGALLRREFAAARGPGLLAMALVLVTAFLLALWPRAVESMLSADIQQSLSGSAVALREPMAVEAARLPLLGPGPVSSGPWGAMEDASQAVRARVPEPLRSVLKPGQFTVSVSKDGLCPSANGCALGMPFPVPGVKSVSGILAFDPQLADHISVTAGRAPAVLDTPSAPTNHGSPVPSEPLEVMVSTETARTMHWSIGGNYFMNVGKPGQPAQQQAMLLTGTFSAKDPDSDYWQLNQSGLRPGVAIDTERGNTVTGRIYANSGSTDFFSYGIVTGSAVRTQLLFPLDTRAISADSAPLLLAQLRSFLAESQVYAPPPPAGTPTVFLTTARFNSEAPALLQNSISRAVTSNAILSILSSGPLGACLAALALAGRLLLDRRASALRVAAARGASGWQLSRTLALEGIWLGLPAGAAGTLAAIAAVPVTLHLRDLLLPAAISFVPAAMLCALHFAGSHQIAARPRRRPIRWRPVAEGSTLALAAGATYLLLQRGPDGAAPSVSSSATADPLLAAAPLLLSLTVCLVVLRLYPFPLEMLARRQKAAAGLIGFLGSVRAFRTRVSLVPVLALVLGLGVIVSSGVLSGTLRAGIQQTAALQVGADISIHGPQFTAEQIRQIQGLPGVDTVAEVTDSGSTPAVLGARSNTVRLVLVDARKLATVTDGFPAAITPAQLTDLTTVRDGRVPVAASSYLGMHEGSQGTITLTSEVAVTVTALGPKVLNLTPGPDWILADAQTFNGVSPRVLTPDQLLLKLSPGIDPAVVHAAIDTLGGPSVTIDSPQQRSSALLATPMMGGLQIGLLAVIVFIGLLCALVMIMTALAGTPARNRQIGLLRTLGFPRSADKSLLAWELVPPAAAATLAGTALGLALPWLVYLAVDLRVFTGGASQPPLVMNASLLAALVGGFALVVALAIAGSILGARRQHLATVLKIGGDE